MFELTKVQSTLPMKRITKLSFSIVAKHEFST